MQPEIELPLVSRPIGLLGRIDDPAGPSIGMLAPFSGLLDVGVGRTDRPTVDLSYLALAGLVGEAFDGNPRSGRRGTDGPGGIDGGAGDRSGAGSARPGGDPMTDADRASEPTVREVLRSAPAERTDEQAERTDDPGVRDGPSVGDPRVLDEEPTADPGTPSGADPDGPLGELTTMLDLDLPGVDPASPDGPAPTDGAGPTDASAGPPDATDRALDVGSPDLSTLPDPSSFDPPATPELPVDPSDLPTDGAVGDAPNRASVDPADHPLPDLPTGAGDVPDLTPVDPAAALPGRSPDDGTDRPDGTAVGQRPQAPGRSVDLAADPTESLAGPTSPQGTAGDATPLPGRPGSNDRPAMTLRTDPVGTGRRSGDGRASDAPGRDDGPSLTVRRTGRDDGRSADADGRPAEGPGEGTDASAGSADGDAVVDPVAWLRDDDGASDRFVEELYRKLERKAAIDRRRGVSR